MKKTLTLFALLCTLTAFGQTAAEHMKNGIAKHIAQNYKEAIKDYDKAIKADKDNKDAYFNRGTCALALNDYKPALSDFSKAIEIDAKYAQAYYSRASVFVKQEKYVEALPDLDKTIELEPKTPNALTLRGQIRAQTGNKKGACEDFNSAKAYGDSQAKAYINQFCGNEQQAGESLMLDWPESENWKVGSNEENDEMAMLVLIHANETLANWTEIGTMISMKGVTNVPMDQAMQIMFAEAKQNAPNAKLTFLEKDESVEYPWILFTIEASSSKNDKRTESQLLYIVQGKTSLYTNFRAVKQATIPTPLKEKWIKFFKTGKVVNK